MGLAARCQIGSRNRNRPPGEDSPSRGSHEIQ
jgi:hypothetical protein